MGMTDAPKYPTEAVRLIALRPLEDENARRLRRDIPTLMARIAAEVAGCRIRLDAAADEHGLVETTVVVDGVEPALQGNMLDEFAAVLAPVAEVEHILLPSERADGPVRLWPLTTRQQAVIGYGDGHVSKSWQSTEPTMKNAIESWPLADLVASTPGCGIRMTIGRDASALDDSTWITHVEVVLPELSTPSFRLRATVRQHWHGLTVADEPTQTPVLLRTRTVDIPAIFAVPIAGTVPLPGTISGAAAPIYVQPAKPVNDPIDRLRIGAAHTPGARIDVSLSATERLRHLHVLGQTGTGKSSLLAGIARGIAVAGDGMLVIDPHGTLVDRILSELPAAAAARTWVIRSGNLEMPIPLNPLATDDAVARDIAIDQVGQMFQYLFDRKGDGIVGPRFRERVAMGMRALAAVHGARASILDVPAALADEAFMRKACSIAGDARLTAWWKNDQASGRSSEHGEVVSWVNSKFEAFSSTASIRGVLGSGVDSFDMGRAIDENRIVLVDLSKALLGEPASRLLGYLHLQRTWEAALRRTSKSPFTVMVDEAHSVISGSLTSMLSEGRKFGLSVVMAHQYLDQLDSDLRPAVDGNVGTTVAFRAAVGDARAMCARFGDTITPAVMTTLPELTAITLRAASGAPARPHTLTVDHNDHEHSRGGSALTRFVDHLHYTTDMELAAPYLLDTIPARDGASAVTATTKDEQEQRPVPRRPSSAPSFLDEWLDKRAKATATTATSEQAESQAT